jgi:hypothetical protein
MGFGTYDTINVGGDKYPIAFNMRVLMQFQNETGNEINPEELMEDLDRLERFVYLGFEEGHRLAGQDMAIAEGSAISVDANTFTKIINLISSSLNGPPTTKDTKTTTEKK